MKQRKELKQAYIKKMKETYSGTAFQQCLLLILLACLLGWIFNHQLLVKSLKGDLLTEIRKKQLSSLKFETGQKNPDTKFIDLVSAKELFDREQAAFIDVRDPEKYAKGTIYGAFGVPPSVKHNVSVERLLPDREAVIVAFSNEAGCNSGVEIAEKMIYRGYHNVLVLEEGYLGWTEKFYPVSIPKRSTGN